jgi:N-acetylglucosaminyl-diphospho-decaprenol L-rhamnosyltransferase
MSRGAPPTAVDVAIVNWNTPTSVLGAAQAFAASTGVEARIGIVDNGSGAEKRFILEEGCPPGVRLLLEENLGYGAAANRVLADGTADLVCISNADVAPRPDAMAELATAATRETDAGMVGPVFGDGADRYHAALPGGAALLGRIFAGSFMRRPAPLPAPGETIEVGQPSGACFLMRRETWERVGGFDEGFFLWYEDVDLAKRLHDAGYRNLVIGSAKVDHSTAASFKQLGGRAQQAIRLPSLERYIRKHHPRLVPAARPLLWLSKRLRAGGGGRRRTAKRRSA